MSADPVIAVERLSKQFDNVVAVNALSFTVERGEIFGLLGPNGAGKTTVIQLLLGLTIPTSGRARLFNLDIRRQRRRIMQRVNFASAYVSLPSNLTVRENLTIFARLYGIRKPAERIRALLDLFDIAMLYDQLTGALSSGQLTRLHLCKALLNDPEILFLDEPTASLDPHIATKVLAVLKQLQRERGMTIIYTSHNMREVEDVCDRIVFLSRGSIVSQGTPHEVRVQAQHASLEEVFIRIARDGELCDTAEESV